MLLWCSETHFQCGVRDFTLPTNSSQNISWVSENSPQFWHYLLGDRVESWVLQEFTPTFSHLPHFIYFILYFLAASCRRMWDLISVTGDRTLTPALSTLTAGEAPHFRYQLQACASDHPAADGGSTTFSVTSDTSHKSRLLPVSDQLGINQRFPGSSSLGLINLIEQLTELQRNILLTRSTVYDKRI